MQVYDWPGNVRELERLIECAVTLAASEWVTIGDLPPALRGDCAEALRGALSRNDTMRAWGARYARLVLDRCQQNKRKACDVLDISYHTLMAYLQWRPDRPPSDGQPQEWPEPAARMGPAAGDKRSDQDVEQAMCG
jgi:DNA-binding NtrC family response regulator